jgi:hypothetical protein
MVFFGGVLGLLGLPVLVLGIGVSHARLIIAAGLLLSSAALVVTFGIRKLISEKALYKERVRMVGENREARLAPMQEGLERIEAQINKNRRLVDRE